MAVATAPPTEAPRSWRARVVGAWDSVQIELHGCYSVRRLRALHEYTRDTSRTRTTLVLLLTPLPCLIAVAFADCIPLAPPEWGIAHSGGFWVRASFASWVYSFSIMEQLRYFMPELPLTGWTTLALSIPVMALTNLCTFALAWWVGFPLPFTIPVLSVPWATFMILILGLRLRGYFRDHPHKRNELVQFVSVCVCQMSLLIIYPAYNAVFYNLSATAQVLFALLLPVIKLVEKNVLSFFMRRMDDLKPEEVIFNVEIFNALFIACCMQNSNSIATNVVLVAVDFAMACISLRDLDGILEEVHQLADKMKIGTSQLQEAVVALCEQYPQLEIQAIQRTQSERIQLSRSRSKSRSRYSSHIARSARPSGGMIAPLSDVSTKVSVDGQLESKTWFTNLKRIVGVKPTDATTARERGRWASGRTGHGHLLAPTLPSGSDVQNDQLRHGELVFSGRLRSAIASSIAALGGLKVFFVHGIPKDEVRVSPAPDPKRLEASIQLLSEEERLCFLAKMLQALHLTEYLLLIEYVEVMIPIVYSIYLVVLFHLPNRMYYPQLRDMDEHKLRRTVGNVMMNAVFEFVSLVLLVRVLRKKLRSSPGQQLSFVLDRQWRMVQTKVVLWVVVTLQSTLYHLGADYSFKFSWLAQHVSPTQSPQSS